MGIHRNMEAYLQIHLAAIAKAFKAPRITIVVRGPEDGNVKGDLVLTNDNPVFVERVFRAQMIERGKLLVGTPEEMDVTVKERTEGGLGPHFEDGGMAADYQPRRGKNGSHESS
jgi:hypothetical protein